ncbi:MAG TPA: DNA primase [Clostridiales bacterium]|nr:DNA primase [Clostridiales bacterium]
MQIKGMDGNFIEELKGRCDIVDVVSSYVPTLNKKGSKYWGNCPFHHEKTPSFTVDREQGFYKCFGCGKGGDVISFVMDAEGITFYEAVKLLADRAHLEMPKTLHSDNGEFREVKERLTSLLRDAARIYHANLERPEAAAAREYINKRGITPSSVRKFGLGYSVGYTEIIQNLKALGYKREEMLKAGVIQEREGKFFDAMANRLVFPIIDAFGKVIAFGGRVLGKTDFAKYKNTDNTAVFVKNKNLYGLNYIKKLRLKTKVTDLIMVEGYMDTLALVQAGVENVVASMGTSLTEEQAKLAARYVEDIYICYDGDSAGQNATLRGLDILKRHGLKVRVISLPNGEDPDEIIKRAGVEEFLKYKNAAVELTEYKLLRLKEGHDFNTPFGRASYAKEAAKIIAELASEVEREIYLDYVAKLTGINKAVVKSEVSAISSGKQDADVIVTAGVQAIEANVQAARFILNRCVMGLEKWEDHADLMPTESLRKVADYLNECQFSGKVPDVGTLYHITSEEEADQIINFDTERYQGSEEAAYKDCLTLLQKEYAKSKIAELNDRYKTCTTDEERNEIMRKIADTEAEYRRQYGRK